MVSELAEEYGEEIVSIALFGSATTKEWTRGKSDIDFIVIIKHRSMKRRIGESLDKIILKLDRKYALLLSRTCSSYKKVSNPLLNLLLKVENSLFFGQPFFVLSLDQIDFENGRISDTRIRFVTTVFDSLSIFVAKMRETGVVIHGSNIIDQLKFSPTKIDKILAAIAPVWIIVMSLLSFPVNKILALNHSIKATIWACEDVLFAFDLPLASASRELETLERVFSQYNQMDFSHAKKNLILSRRLLDENEVTGGFVARHLLQTIRFVFTLYFYANAIARNTKFVDRNLAMQEIR